ncbi:DUF2267 domain-containing protein [Candidatus Woesearchaeota archaeon]|nr:DUF2267 domain-containing protein [Candidatus Woesearchaeota archaeon]
MTFNAIDAGLHKANEWIKELMEDLGIEDKQTAFTGMKAVLQALRDRLTIEETVQLGAQLPVLIRGYYYESWEPAGKPLKMDKERFISRVHSYAHYSETIEPERFTRAVFRLLQKKISKGEIEDIKHMLPKTYLELWPDAAYSYL